MSITVLVPVADGSEEIEAVTIIDVLRRAGAQVTVASVNAMQITASRGVKIVTDGLIEDYADQEFTAIALPGGMPGAAHLRDNPVLKKILLRQYDQGRIYAAICAAPAVVLAHHGLLLNRRATCHPNFVAQLVDRSAVDSRVVVDGPCVTSRGPGTALEFALKLVALLFGEKQRDAVAGPMVVD